MYMYMYMCTHVYPFCLYMYVFAVMFLRSCSCVVGYLSLKVWQARKNKSQCYCQ